MPEPGGPKNENGLPQEERVDPTAEVPALDLATEINAAKDPDDIKRALKGHSLPKTAKAISKLVKLLSSSYGLGEELQAYKTAILKIQDPKFIKKEWVDLQDEGLVRKIADKLIEWLERDLKNKSPKST